MDFSIEIQVLKTVRTYLKLEAVGYFGHFDMPKASGKRNGSEDSTMKAGGPSSSPTKKNKAYYCKFHIA